MNSFGTQPGLLNVAKFPCVSIRRSIFRWVVYLCKDCGTVLVHENALCTLEQASLRAEKKVTRKGHASESEVWHFGCLCMIVRNELKLFISWLFAVYLDEATSWKLSSVRAWSCSVAVLEAAPLRAPEMWALA